MSVLKTLPPAYVTYRAVVSVLVLALLAVAVLAVTGELTAWWQTLLSWCHDVRRAWTDMHWKVV